VGSKNTALRAQKTGESAKVSTFETYRTFDEIDGSHSFKSAVPNGYIEYPARTRHGGSVFFFNFRLAREMGLIAKDHPDEMTESLRVKVLDTFSIVIINEYDQINEIKYPEKDIRKNKFMATRYLQLQHPNKQGKTSGDGRGIWNGEYTRNGSTWDITSSGTGATCLSPAHAQTKKFFKTGDKVVGYGNGYNSLSDGLSAALMSDVFHQNGIETEQTLAIISFEGGFSINVRAGKNLFRPAHFFHQLKQGNYHGLRASIDFFIDRQMKNGDFPKTLAAKNKKARYQYVAEYMARTFARISAQFEAEYIFCWLDWDGDNILANGGIIDYGSVRQFGLYHWEYRYDDVDRMSTNIPEQKNKAKYIVQNFAQIRNFLVTGKKKNIRRFRKDPILKLFDDHFTKVLHETMLQKLGFAPKQIEFLMTEHPGTVKRFKKSHSHFEKTKSSKGIYKIDDGITADAIFSMQDIHRELPKALLKNEMDSLDAEAFIAIIKSTYARPRDLEINSYRRKEVKNFQKYYLKLVKQVANQFKGGDLKRTLLEVTMRASVANRSDRITGDSILHVTSSLIRNDRHLTFEQKHQVIDYLVAHQVDQTPPVVEADTKAGKIVLRNIQAIRDYRHGF
jgi:uncharacterized protein YdiU (UPF0061 family)